MLFHPQSETLRAEKPVTLIGPNGERRAATMSVRPGAGRRIIGRIQGVDDEDAARNLHGWAVCIARELLPPVEEGEYYIHDLLGLNVLDEQGVQRGTLADVVAGGRDVWVIDTPDGEVFVLATPENILKVDIAARTVCVRSAALVND